MKKKKKRNKRKSAIEMDQSSEYSELEVSN